jgi:hypothetical protein
MTEQIEVLRGVRGETAASIAELSTQIRALQQRIFVLEGTAAVVALGNRIQGFVNANSGSASSMSAAGGIGRYGPLAATGAGDASSMAGFNMVVSGSVARTEGADSSAAAGTVT